MHVKGERSNGRGGGKEQRVPRAEPETNREPLRRRRPVTQAATSSAERKTWRGSPARGGAAHPDIRTEAPGDPCAADAAPLRSARPLASPCSGSASPSPSCPLPPLLPLRAEQTRKRENGASLPGSLRGDAV